MRLRVAVHQIESWLMADAERLSAFLSVGTSLLPGDPDGCHDAKHEMVRLVRESRRLQELSRA